MGIFQNVYRDGDHAGVADVRLNVDYANGDLTGTLDVDGEANLPVTTDVLEPVTYGSALQFTGEYFTADVGDVRFGVVYGKANAATGLLDLPAVADVRLGTVYDQTTKSGLIAVPADTEVLLGVAIDQGVGNSRLPIEADVRLSVLFGPSDTLIGALDDSGDVCNYPGVSDVRLGVVYATGQLTGNVRVPTPDVVQSGYVYDTLDLVTGTLLTTVGSQFSTEDDFNVVRGDDYEGDDISWEDDGRWPDLTGATVIVGFVGEGTASEYNAVVTLGNPAKVSLPLTKDETAVLRTWYDYDVQATLSGGEVKTLVSGRVRAYDTQTDIPPDIPIPPGSPA